jgi:hypothetical protein
MFYVINISELLVLVHVHVAKSVELSNRWGFSVQSAHISYFPHLFNFILTNIIPYGIRQQAFNYISNKGYARMSREDEKHWVDLMNVIHDSVKGGMKYNTGTLLMVLSRPVGSNATTAKAPAKDSKAPSKDGKVMNP